MGHQANVKVLRGQLRQIVKEMFPEVVKSELYQDLQKSVNSSLENVHKMVRDTLERIDNRQKDVQSLIMRELIASKSVVPPQDAPSEAPKAE